MNDAGLPADAAALAEPAAAGAVAPTPSQADNPNPSASTSDSLKRASYRKPVIARQDSFDSFDSADDSPTGLSDDALEALAAELASQEPEQAWEFGLTGTLASSLRRRLTTKRAPPPPPYRRDAAASSASLASTDAGATAGPSQVVEADKPMTAEDAEVRRQIEEMEDLEVAAFLERVGRQLQDVRVAAPAAEVAFPKKRAFARLDGTIDWKAYAHAVSSLHL